MTVPVDLDPREVLEHLRSLGYHHVTKEQLKQFIKDLKKLIRHDLRKIQSQQENQREVEISNFKHSSNHGHERRVLCEKNHAEKPLVETKSKSVAVQTIVPPKALEESVTSATNVPVSGASSTKCATCCACQCCQPNGPGKTPVSRKENSASKPVSSFIKVAPNIVKDGKTDPVTLYHYYQSLWARQNRPGENPHSDIRWRIRHKMMGPTVVRSKADKKRENPPWVE